MSLTVVRTISGRAHRKFADFATHFVACRKVYDRKRTISCTFHCKMYAERRMDWGLRLEAHIHTVIGSRRSCWCEYCASETKDVSRENSLAHHSLSHALTHSYITHALLHLCVASTEWNVCEFCEFDTKLIQHLRKKWINRSRYHIFRTIQTISAFFVVWLLLMPLLYFFLWKWIDLLTHFWTNLGMARILNE